ncbi:LysR family transcriptional regulator [Endozoicomonas arenosclerae]|uniref:LysR family transcriptional regulator n=1 Tax=Endozoicomonas arenosclerae TaxID=1633495 RepID=UPI0007860278|nr:LysR family transcriptional regulator [Endozoicomonas arenosclerae]
MNLSRLNLNLLPGLKALLDTQSVSKAAQMMCVTQSAMSRTLAQLREALNDPILVRKGNRIFLSEKAMSLHEDVNRVVSEASSIFENQQFDIATTQRHFRIASGHMVLERILPEVLQKIWAVAPGLTFELQAINPAVDVATGKLDLSIGYMGIQDEGLSSFSLMKDRMCLILCENHPLAHEAFSEEALSAFSFVVQRDNMNLHQQGEINNFLQTVQVKTWSPSLSVSLALIKGTDCVFLAPESLSMFMADLSGYVIRECPKSIPPVSFNIVWPEYWELNRAHRWMREFVRDELLEHIQSKELDMFVSEPEGDQEEEAPQPDS